uniref:CSON010163 protein n=1 Tax=Culicoides sonorensis TaxID=179676 RepID=A0A336LKQ9_CULSO
MEVVAASSIKISLISASSPLGSYHKIIFQRHFVNREISLLNVVQNQHLMFLRNSSIFVPFDRNLYSLLTRAVDIDKTPSRSVLASSK